MTATHRGTTTCGGRSGEAAGREGEGRRGARWSDSSDEGSDGAAETAEGPPGTGRTPRTAAPSAIPPSSTPTIASSERNWIRRTSALSDGRVMSVSGAGA